MTLERDESNVDPRDLLDLEVRIEGGADLTVGPQARAAMQADVIGEIEFHLNRFLEQWHEADVTDLEAMKALSFEAGTLAAAARALRYLAPAPYDGEEDE